MNLVDSSGWLEYFSNGKNADFFAGPLESSQKLIVPAICIFEVFKKVLKERGESAAFQSVALMQKGETVPLDTELSVSAARLSLKMKLPMADSIILATARKFNAVIWTQDADFKTLSSVKFIDKKN